MRSYKGNMEKIFVFQFEMTHDGWNAQEVKVVFDAVVSTL